MSVPKLLGQLRDQGIHLWADGDRLRFNAPRGTLSDGLREAIATQRQEILDFLRSMASEGLPPLAPRERTGRAPLSFAQSRIWFHEKLAPTGATYHIPGALRIDGPFDVERCRRAVDRIVRRHAVLRTCIEEESGVPMQIVRSGEGSALSVLDLQGLPVEKRDRQALGCLQRVAEEPFDLSRGPLARFALVRVSPEHSYLGISLHHMVADGWSIAVLIQELTAGYGMPPGTGATGLRELPLQYTDFAYWQREHLQGETLKRHLLYWTRRLAGAPPVSELPSDWTRPSIQTYRGACTAITWSRQQTASLQRFAYEEKVTPFMLLLSAFYVLLHRFTQQRDLVIGTPVAGRDHPDLEGLIGPFVNTLALRCGLFEGAGVRSLLKLVREQTLADFEHKELPFEILVDELRPPRDLSRSPLYQILFNHLNQPRPTLELPGAHAVPVVLDTRTAKLDLSLASELADGRLVISMEINTDLFDAARARLFLECYSTLLAGFVHHPGSRVCDLDLLTPAQRHSILVEWNDTRRAPSGPPLIHQRFAEQIARTPEAVAVEFAGESLTYRHLAARVWNLASRLKALGVGPGIPVGIHIARSVEMVIGVLGVLVAGGAYVTLDAELPIDRVRFMIDDAGTDLVLTTGAAAELLARPGLRTLCVDRSPAPEPASLSCSLPFPSGRDLAYVIYTSGSTGRPKGVAVSHGSVVNLLSAMDRSFGLGPGDTLVSLARLSFDMSTLELLLPLTAGSRLVLVRQEAARDGSRLAQILAATRATVMQATPATWRMLLNAGWSCPRGFQVLCGGEAMPRELAERLLAGGAELWNLYGPTETTVWSSLHRVDAATEPVPVGRPIDNTRIYVLDPGLRPVPPGVAGELFIAGEGLARGYCQPEMTAERFLPEVFSAGPGTRMYRTGDRARLLMDGTVQCLGRCDGQVKVRGYRIEPGEIESVLAEHPMISAAVVVAQEDAAGQSRLVAYIVFAGDRVRPKDLRSFLAARLPDYMIPATYIALDFLPLNANGKVDRLALPIQDRAGLESDPEVLPRTRTEAELAEIWEDVLRCGPVGIHDNFFEIGGHSLLAVTLGAKIRQRFGQELPVERLFQNPTIEGLATLLGRHAGRPGWLVKLRGGGPRPPLFLVPGASGNPYSYLRLARCLGDDQPVYGFQLPGFGEDDRPLDSIEDLASLYLEEIRLVQPEGPHRLAGHSFGAAVAYEMACQLAEQGQEVERLIMLDLPVPRGADASVAGRGETQWLVEIADAVAQYSGVTIDLAEGDLRSLDSAQRHACFMSHLIRCEVVPPDTGPELVRLLLHVYQAGERALSAWRPRPYPGGIILFRSADQEMRSDERDPALGWQSLAAGPVDILETEGGHITMITEPHVRELGHALRKCLESGEANLLDACRPTLEVRHGG